MQSSLGILIGSDFCGKRKLMAKMIMRQMGTWNEVCGQRIREKKNVPNGRHYVDVNAD